MRRCIRLAIMAGMYFFSPLIAESNDSPSNETAFEQLRDQPTDFLISQDQLTYWINQVKQLADQDPVKDGDFYRLSAYLCNAQEDFTDLSYQIKGKPAGSLAPISSEILKLFFPDFQPNPSLAGLQDPYSQQLTALIFPSFEARFHAENESIKPYEEKDGVQFWKGAPPAKGIAIGNMQPWGLKSSKQFRACPPPPPHAEGFWNMQLDTVKSAMRTVTPQKLEKIYFWAGLTSHDDGDWMVIADRYMQARDIPVAKQLEVRAKLATALEDANIAVFDSKYTYWVKRPHMLDSGIAPLISCPNHPSYPSGHSTLSAAAMVILSHYFPEDKRYWESLADEAGNSRIWAGIHFPIDHQAGQNLGRQIGAAVLAAKPY